MNLCWLTDIHLNFLSEKERLLFYKKISKTNCDALVITGDIADAPSLSSILREMAQVLQKPIYFVLGNHDYYHSGISEVKKEVRELCRSDSLLHWLSEEQGIMLNQNTVLLGQDGWADGRYGDYQNSRVVLNDSRVIHDLFKAAILGRNQLLQKMQELADFDAKAMSTNLTSSIAKGVKKIIILTHVSPFDASCWHEGKMNTPDWMPFFTSKAMGDVILSIAKNNPTIDFLVLCGHTHSSSIYQSLPNLLVKAGKAEYYQPEIQELISV